MLARLVTQQERCNDDPNFLSNILFTDESTFYLHGHLNPAVTRYWSRTNLHVNVPKRTQYPQKRNVCAGILGDNIIGPFVIPGNLNGAVCRDVEEPDPAGNSRKS